MVKSPYYAILLSIHKKISACLVWGSIGVLAVARSAVCTALDGKTPVTPWRPEDLAGPDHAGCPANGLFVTNREQKT